MTTVTDSPDDPVASELLTSSDRTLVTVRAAGELPDADTMARALAPPTSAPPGAAVVVDLSAVTYLPFEAVPPLMRLRDSSTAGVRNLRSRTGPRPLGTDPSGVRALPGSVAGGRQTSPRAENLDGTALSETGWSSGRGDEPGQ